MPGSNLLVEKISSALSAAGYGEDAVGKVSRLINTNTVEARGLTVKAFTATIPEQVDLSSQTEALDPESLRARNIYLNSNEPVVLLNVSDTDTAISEVHSLKKGLLAMLKSKNIRPVRVYVRKVSDIDTEQFGFCLLNVVNTDIGGPSMIQLLDSSFHNEDWSRDLIVKEAYNGEDLLWGAEVSASSEARVDVVDSLPTSVDQPDLGKDEAEYVPQGVGDTSEVEEAPLGALVAPRTSNTEVDASIDDTDESEEEAQTEHPAMAELRQQDLVRPSVNYPTWSREHDSQGLLDIITTHSASVQDDEHVSTIKAGREVDSGEFELIDKPK